MTPLQMEIEPASLARLKRAMDKLGRPDVMEGVLETIGKAIKGKARHYPPARPRRTVGWWYERGYGWQLDGVRREETSEHLGDRWYVKVFPSYTEIGNTATYAGWVHGDVQRYIHEKQGWRKLYDVAMDEMPALLRAAADQCRKIWEGKA